MALTHRPPLRVALFGLPGAGKSTTASLLAPALARTGLTVTVVKLAGPLYDVQHAFYERLRAHLSPGQQDGALLNFLGSHFRRVEPGFLVADFARRCEIAALSGADVLLCDDARPADLDGLVAKGFRLVRVSAPEALRRERKAGRGDRTAGRDDHPTELGGEGAVPDFEVVNAGSLTALEEHVAVLGKGIADQRHGAEAPSAGGPGGQSGLLAELVQQARRVIAGRYAENRHQIGALVVAADGRVFTGLHVEAMVGRASVCAEAVAVGKAREAGAQDLRLVLAVRHPKPSEAGGEPRLVPPCGLCRELLLDYGPDIQAIIDSPAGPVPVPMAHLLPHKYVGTKWAGASSATR